MRQAVMLSGGMDSTFLLLRFPDAIAVTINYGQPAAELQAARRIAEMLGRDFTAGTLTFPRLEPDGGVDAAFRPGRNLLLLTLGAALVPGDVQLLFGGVQEDQAGFPDCRPAFLEAAGRTISLALQKQVEVVGPLVATTKADIVASALPSELQVLRLSVSCYRGEVPGCGTCSACRKREAAGLR